MSRTANAIAMVTLLTLVAAPAAAKRIDREFNETFSVSEGASLELSHGDGDVEIKSWDRDSIEVDVVYRAEIRRIGLRAEPDFEVDFERHGSTVVVRGRELGTRGIGITFRDKREYRYTIKAPSYVVLDLRGDDGDVDVEGWRAGIECRLDDGDIKLVDIAADKVSIDAEDGDVEIDGLSGELDVTVDDGDVEIWDCDTPKLKIRAEDGDVSLEGCKGNFRIAVDDGRVDLTGAHASVVEIRSNDGEVDVELLSAEDLDLDIRADDGDVVLDLADGIGATFSLETDDGSLNVAPEGRVQTEGRTRLSGEIGDGSGRIRIATSDGNITLR